MAFPKKSGLRQITVNNVVYRWRYSDGEMRGAVTIYGPNSSDRVTVIKSYEWFDIWLSYPFARKMAPQDVTPALVRRAIEFALANGWAPSERGEALSFWYHGSEFQTTEPGAQAIEELRTKQFKQA